MWFMVLLKVPPPICLTFSQKQNTVFLPIGPPKYFTHTAPRLVCAYVSAYSASQQNLTQFSVKMKQKTIGRHAGTQKQREEVSVCRHACVFPGQSSDIIVACILTADWRMYL